MELQMKRIALYGGLVAATSLIVLGLHESLQLPIVPSAAKPAADPLRTLTTMGPAETGPMTRSSLAEESRTPFEGRLKVVVTGFKPGEGDLHLAVFRQAETFPDPQQAFQSRVVPVGAASQPVEFAELQEGSYAVAVFQDADGNGCLTKGTWGIPQEAYGFSRNARGTLGPPSFEQAQVSVGEGQIEIRLK